MVDSDKSFDDGSDPDDGPELEDALGSDDDSTGGSVVPEGPAVESVGMDGMSAEVALLLQELLIILTAPVEAVSASTTTGNAYSRP